VDPVRWDRSVIPVLEVFGSERRGNRGHPTSEIPTISRMTMLYAKSMGRSCPILCADGGGANPVIRSAGEGEAVRACNYDPV